MDQTLTTSPPRTGAGFSDSHHHQPHTHMNTNPLDTLIAKREAEEALHQRPPPPVPQPSVWPKVGHMTLITLAVCLSLFGLAVAKVVGKKIGQRVSSAVLSERTATAPSEWTRQGVEILSFDSPAPLSQPTEIPVAQPFKSYTIAAHRYTGTAHRGALAVACARLVFKPGTPL